MPKMETTLSQRFADFPGWLSPMLVKELRQGLRTNLFVIAFILLQTFMIICLMIGAASPRSDSTSGFFWFFVYVTLLLVQPIRGFGALANEFRLNTMELLQLTSLDAWRIVLGKWTALNAQTLLLIVGIAPYLVMRHFLGGVNFVTDLIILGFLALSSAFFSALVIGISAFRSTLIRVIILIVSFIVLINTGGFIVFGRFSGSFSAFSLSTSLVVIATCIYGCFFFLSIGAGRIAPRSENLATRKRLVSLAYAVGMLLSWLAGVDEDLAIPLSGIALALASMDAITEPLPLVRSVAQPFRKARILRVLAHVLTPGWYTGILFFAIAFLTWATGVALIADFPFSGSELFDEDYWILLFALAGIITFPLLVIHLFFSSRTQSELHFTVYLFVQVSLLILTVLISVAAETSRDFEEYVFFFVPIPSVTLVGSIEHHTDGGYFFILSLVTAALPWLLAFIKARPLRKDLSQVLAATT